MIILDSVGKKYIDLSVEPIRIEWSYNKKVRSKIV